MQQITMSAHWDKSRPCLFRYNSIIWQHNNDMCVCVISYRCVCCCFCLLLHLLLSYRPGIRFTIKCMCEIWFDEYTYYYKITDIQYSCYMYSVYDVYAFSILIRLSSGFLNQKSKARENYWPLFDYLLG